MIFLDRCNFSDSQNVISDKHPPPPIQPPTTLSLIVYENRYATYSIPTYSTESRLFLSMPLNHLSPYL